MSKIRLDINKVIHHLRRHSTDDQIKSLLRKYSESNDVLIGTTKEDSLKNLLIGFRKGVIPPHEIVTQVRESEENGGQFIYHYKLKTESRRSYYEDGETIAKKLFGKKWRDKYKFPNIHDIPNDFVWADYRLEIDGYRDKWFVKVYDKEEYLKLNVRKSKETPTERRLVYNKIRGRVVFIARWNTQGHLEIRISRRPKNSPTRRVELLDNFIEILSNAININDFQEYNHDNTRELFILF